MSDCDTCRNCLKVQKRMSERCLLGGHGKLISQTLLIVHTVENLKFDFRIFTKVDRLVSRVASSNLLAVGEEEAAGQ